jgi:cystinosin
MSLALTVLSQVVGWVYFFAWSISFYPQIYLNWKRKCVTGFSIDFAMYNFTGFSAYSAYCLWGYSKPGVIPGIVDI